MDSGLFWFGNRFGLRTAGGGGRGFSGIFCCSGRKRPKGTVGMGPKKLESSAYPLRSSSCSHKSSNKAAYR